MGSEPPPIPGRFRPPERIGSDGLTPRTRTAKHAVTTAFGVNSIGGYCPGGCTTGHIPGSDHYTGHAIDIMLTPVNDTNRALGDTIAAWLVANADHHAVHQIIWNTRIWTRERATEGWSPYHHPTGRDTDTHAHRDHIHLGIT